MDGWRKATVARLPSFVRASPSPTDIVVLPSPSGVGVVAETRMYLALGVACNSSIAASSILATWRPYGTRCALEMPIRAAMSPSGAGWPALAI